MGHMIEGEWRAGGLGGNDEGVFERKATSFRDRVRAEEVEAGRYRLYVSYACPWAHRCLIVRALRGLEDAIDVSVVHWFMGEDGWSFDPEAHVPVGLPGSGAGVVPDPDGASFLREVYRRAKADYTGRVTVPVLWDTKERRIVNNESREIVRMLDDEFRGLGDPETHFHPAALHERIEAAIDAIYEPINNGVYRAGFATAQAAYEQAVGELFGALDHWEGVLEEQEWLCGDRMTEADIFLFTTLIRFEPVYHYHFKCNRKRLRDYPRLWRHTRRIYALPGVAETVDFEHIKRHYFTSHESVNPSRVVPAGPELDLSL